MEWCGRWTGALLGSPLVGVAAAAVALSPGPVTIGAAAATVCLWVCCVAIGLGW